MGSEVEVTSVRAGSFHGDGWNAGFVVSFSPAPPYFPDFLVFMEGSTSLEANCSWFVGNGLLDYTVWD